MHGTNAIEQARRGLHESFTHPDVQACLDLAKADAQLDDHHLPIARGGMGLLAVGLTRQGRSVVIKIPRYDSRPESEHWILEHGLRREAQVLGALRAVRIPRLVASHIRGKYLVRNYISGATLSDAIKHGENDAKSKIKLLHELFRTCAELFPAFHNHPLGCFVIRDFKPRNLIVSLETRCLVLVDVGGVRLESDMTSRSPRPHRIGSGKWRFWAPEQLLEDQSSLSSKADYFAFGATAYFILAGAAPYANDAKPESLMRSYRARHQELLVVVECLVQELGVHAEVGRTIVSCLNPDADKRNADFAATAQMLQHEATPTI